jgi:lipopolysaccharide/colanic/teichoic acid biosynthesis glycosyltransferase
MIAPTIRSPLAEFEHVKIVITGASGSIGRRLVSDFLARGAQLLLVGRNPAALQVIFPNVECCDYTALDERGRDYDGLLHLAVLNNNVQASDNEFDLANVNLTETVLLSARRARIARLVYTSTVQALDEQNASPYAKSKKRASERVAAEQALDTRILYLSAVIGDQPTGRMAIFGKLPPLMRKPLLALYSAITPVTDIADVSIACWDALTQQDHPRLRIIARDQSKNFAFSVIKRCVDLTAALVILIPFIWLLAGLWLIVRLQSRGPGIFAQKRVGQNGQVFTCYKFRTMSEGSPNVGTHEAPTSLVTPFGKVLRRTKLDELPQAYNILLNQMSLVGPRPCLPNQNVVIAERLKLGVLEVKPGITGLAQIKRVDMSQPELLAHWDARYVKLRSLRLDLSILVRTLLGRGNGDAMDMKTNTSSSRLD